MKMSCVNINESLVRSSRNEMKTFRWQSGEADCSEIADFAWDLDN